MEIGSNGLVGALSVAVHDLHGCPGGLKDADPRVPRVRVQQGRDGVVHAQGDLLALGSRQQSREELLGDVLHKAPQRQEKHGENKAQADLLLSVGLSLF